MHSDQVILTIEITYGFFNNFTFFFKRTAEQLRFNRFIQYFNILKCIFFFLGYKILNCTQPLKFKTTLY